MSKKVDAAEAARLLLKADDILILTHKNPDGDTLGSGFALCAALRGLNKRAHVVNADRISARYSYMSDEHDAGELDFEPRFIVAVDTAAVGLMGELSSFADKVDLCIDHHGTNEGYAETLWCDPEAASCGEMVYELLCELGVGITPYIANCLYTGVSTDTGCFRYANTTAKSHRVAAALFESGCDFTELNRLLFETKTRERAKLEQLAMAGIEYALEGRLAFITVTLDMLERSGCSASDVEGITAMARTIEGVEAGVTLREQQNGSWKVSVRTVTLDAASLCENFGGGGHKRAAGFECSGTAFDVKCVVCGAVEAMLG